MKIKYFSLILMAVISLNVVSQEMPVYKIFDKNGEPVTYEK